MRKDAAWICVTGVLVACVSIPDASEDSAATGGSAGVAGSAGNAGSAGTLPLHDSGVCPSGEFKPCGESCVPKTDPNYGCAAETCAPCAGGEHVAALGCIQGQCAAAACEPSFGDCNGKLSDGCELGLNADSQNCGACGWDCYGSGCTLGQCQPQLIVENLQTAEDILIDGDTLYIAHQHVDGVRVFGLDGTPKSGPSVSHANALDMDADYLYITTDTELQRWPKAGGALASLSNGPFYKVAVDADDAWLATWNGSESTVLKVPKAGGPQQVVHTQTARIRSLAVDETTVYFGDQNGFLRRYTKATGAKNSALQHGLGTWSVVLTSDMIYWRGGWGVLGALKGSDDKIILFDGQEAARDLAYSMDKLFWTDGKTVIQGELTGAKVQRSLASLPLDPNGAPYDSWAIDANDDFVFYATRTPYGTLDGEAYRVRRPPP